MSTILLVGKDALLQETRGAVLRTIGADIVCTHPDSALDVQANRACDLVVLCHSLSGPQSTELAKTIRSRWPATRILLMSCSRIWEAGQSMAAVDAISSTDPEHLVMKAVELLGRRQPRGVRSPDHSLRRIPA